MSLDLSWIWDWLQSVVDAVNSFFSNIWQQVQNISNTGQGIFSGLTALGSMLWDALTKIGDAFKKIGEALANFGSWFWRGINEGFKWIWQAFASLPQAIHGGLQWVWNGIWWAVRQVVTFFKNAWNWLRDQFQNITSALKSWVEGWRDAVNQWWTNIFKHMRGKLKQSIWVSISIAGTWKAAEGAVRNPSLASIGKAVASAIIAPSIGYLVAELVESMVPSPQTSTFELIPPITVPEIALPSLEVEEVPAPSPPPAPPAPAIGYGLPYDITLELPEAAVETTTRSSDVELGLPATSVEATTEST